MRKIRIFVDMDGTLCRWRAAKKIEEIYEKGWFCDLPPQNKVVDAIRRILLDGLAEVFVLSAVPESDFAIPEKNAWLDCYLPGIDKEHRIFVDFQNAKKPDAVPGGIRKADILLDDYSKNLREWESAGGTAVKLYNDCNGNFGTWIGDSCSFTDEAECIKNTLLVAGLTALGDEEMLAKYVS